MLSSSDGKIHKIDPDDGEIIDVFDIKTEIESIKNIRKEVGLVIAFIITSLERITFI